MIRIDKGEPPPELIAAEFEHVEQHKTEFDAAQAGYMSGENTFEFSDDYKMSPVVDRLRERQYNKCCFSEAKFSGDYAHVEHFRPKGRIDLLPEKTKQYPGYYWLAYNWDNLFLCKAIINTSHKRNFFPLGDGSLRNRTHHDHYLEDGVLIDPGQEDPRVHIRFHNDEPEGVTSRGTENIRLLGLRHSLFEEDRRTKFKVLKAMKTAVDEGLAAEMAITHPVLAILVAELRAAILPSAEFSSMAIDLLSGWLPLA